MKLDLNAAASALAALAAERTRLEERIETSSRTREEIAHARLPLSDVEALVQAQISSLSSAPPPSLLKGIDMMATRPGSVWDSPRGAPFLPDDGLSVARFFASVLGPEVAAGIHRVFATMEEHPDAGPPLAERAKRLEALDRQLEQDTASLAALREQAEKAGLSWPDRGLYS